MVGFTLAKEIEKQAEAVRLEWDRIKWRLMKAKKARQPIEYRDLLPWTRSLSDLDRSVENAFGGFEPMMDDDHFRVFYGSCAALGFWISVKIGEPDRFNPFRPEAIADQFTMICAIGLDDPIKGIEQWVSAYIDGMAWDLLGAFEVSEAS